MADVLKRFYGLSCDIYLIHWDNPIDIMISVLDYDIQSL